nr:MAG TPA: hypothetical protein [Caudoviricetes sp.]
MFNNFWYFYDQSTCQESYRYSRRPSCISKGVRGYSTGCISLA